MNEAQKIKNHLESAPDDIRAYTLHGGYAMHKKGRISRFATGKALEERRANGGAGRVKNALYEYADGSRLRFRWSPERGSSLEVETVPSFLRGRRAQHQF